MEIGSIVIVIAVLAIVAGVYVTNKVLSDRTARRRAEVAELGRQRHVARVLAARRSSPATTRQAQPRRDHDDQLSMPAYSVSQQQSAADIDNVPLPAPSSIFFYRQSDGAHFGGGGSGHSWSSSDSSDSCSSDSSSSSSYDSDSSSSSSYDSGSSSSSCD